MTFINGQTLDGAQVYRYGTGSPEQAVAAPDGKSIAVVGAVTGVLQSYTLAKSASATAGSSVTTNTVPGFQSATVLVNVSAATTVTVDVLAADGAAYTAATWTASAAGTNAIAVNAKGFGIVVSTSAAVTWTVEAITQN